MIFDQSIPRTFLVALALALAVLVARVGAVFAACNYGCILWYDFEVPTDDGGGYHYFETAAAYVINQDGDANNKEESEQTNTNQMWLPASYKEQCSSTKTQHGQMQQGCTGGDSTPVDTPRHCVDQSSK